MFKNLYFLIVFLFIAGSNFLSAEIEYKIEEIGTLQTQTSEAIAFNDEGQILGWYNLDGSNTGKHFFFRNQEGVFFELPEKESSSGLPINWQYLTEVGKVYGIFEVSATKRALCIWDEKHGIVKLGLIPGKEIAAINKVGQVLIKSITENENGKSICRPFIWDNGKVTKLNGLEGNTGLLSEESYGYDMNNQGEVVGQSLISIVYKNEIYKQIHAVMWTNNGQVVDLHKKIPKESQSVGICINDKSEILIKCSDPLQGANTYFIGKDAICRQVSNGYKKINNRGDLYSESFHMQVNGTHLAYIENLNQKIKCNPVSIWMNITKFIKVNSKGQILAHGTTVYGEKHIMLLTPVKS